MASREKQAVHAEKTAPAGLDHHATMFAVLAGNAAQIAEVQKSLFGLATSCAANILESAMSVQTEVARMSLDAMLHGDPAALMSLGQRAARAGFREGMDCAARNLATAQSLGARVLDTVSTPPSGKPVTP